MSARLTDAEIEAMAVRVNKPGFSGCRKVAQAIRQLQSDLAAVTAERDALAVLLANTSPTATHPKPQSRP